MSDQQPLTRRELREQERRRVEGERSAGDGTSTDAHVAAEVTSPAQRETSAAPAAAPATATTPVVHGSPTAPEAEQPSVTVEPVDWRVGTADMGPVREQLDARVAAASAASAEGPPTASAPVVASDVAPTASTASTEPPLAEAAPATSRRARRRDLRAASESSSRGAAVPGASEASQASEPARSPAQAAHPNMFGAAAVAADVESTPPAESTAVAAAGADLDAAAVSATDVAHNEAAPTSGVPTRPIDPIAVDDEIEPGGHDSDDYFERLALASAGDASTGMIVMPEMLNPEITGALSRSGDVMVTGSMRVSRDLSSYGAYRDGLDQEFDDEDADIVFEGDRGEHAPVRARDAISSRSRTGVRVTPSPERRINTWIWIVVGAIGVAAIGGAGVLLYGLMSGWF